MEQSPIQEWFIQYADDVYNYLVYFTRSRDVEDLVQDTFLKALKGIHGYHGSASPRTWLFSIARNIAIDRRRKSHTRRAELVELLDAPSEGYSPETLAVLGDSRDRVLQAMERMKPGYREVVILRIMMDMSVAETARVLGWTTARVNVTLHRALKSLRNTFEIMPGGIPNASTT